MDFKLNIGEIDYGTLAMRFLPLMHDKFQDADGMVGKILLGVSAMPPELAKMMLEALPQDTKDSIAAYIINKNKDKIIDGISGYLHYNGIPVTIRNLAVEL